jgi:hypothetical protein
MTLREALREFAIEYYRDNFPRAREMRLDGIIGKILESLPEKQPNEGVSEYYSGYNQALDDVKKGLRHG